ncbi:unnamed protein product, partial [Mesorhabditis spiculigera]
MTTSSRFYDSTPQRTFRIICDGHELYANGGYLAAMSNYFQTICCGQYIESLNRTVKLPDVPVSEMVEFLDYACPNDESCERETQITEKNIVVIYTLADRFLFPSIRKEVEWFIKQRIHLQNSFSIDTLLDLVMLMKDNLFDKTVKPKLFHKLAIFGVEAVGKVLKGRADIVDQEFILKTMGEHVDFWTGRARDMGWGIWDFVLGYISLEVRTISFDPNVPCGVWSCGVARIDAEISARGKGSRVGNHRK